MTTQCLCQICTCGRHQCPHAPPPTVIPTSRSDSACVLSEYREKFQSHGALRPRTSKKVNDEFKPMEGDMSNITTIRADYIAHQVSRPLPRASKPYEPPSEPMLLRTTYASDYSSPPSLTRNITRSPVHYSAPTTKMDTQSMYQDEYRRWDVVKRQPFKTKDNLTLNQEALQATSTCRGDYCTPPPTAPRQSFKPPPAPQPHHDAPFEGVTCYSEVYVAHPLTRRPPRQKAVYKPSSAPLCGQSTHRHDYRGLKGEVRRSTKTKPLWEPSSAPFAASSEFQDRYRAWSAPHPPAVSARPPIRAWCQGTPAASHSWEAQTQRATQTTPPSGAAKTADPTTSRPQTAPPSVKPTPRPPGSPPAESGTVYRSTYTRHDLRPCPASFSSPPGFRYHRMGRRGHLLYRSVSAGEGGSPCRGTPPPSSSPNITSSTPSRPATASPSRTSYSPKNRPVRSAVLRRGTTTH